MRDAELLERIRRLGIPPAWAEVWIAPQPHGHIQAVGIDAAGRRQYLYHPTWRAQKDRAKFDRMLALAETLPAARRAVTRSLRTQGATRERALAAAFRMLDTAGLRVGSERYAQEHGSYGLSTLLCAHARVREGRRVELRFPGKSGHAWEVDVVDADLAAWVALVRRRGGRARLLSWRDEAGRWHAIRAEEINAEVRERTGGEFTAKDFRTLHGTIAAAVSLARTGPQATDRARRRAVAQAMRDAAEDLGNTPAIARSSYVDPRVVDRYAHGETIDPARIASAESELRALLFE